MTEAQLQRICPESLEVPKTVEVPQSITANLPALAFWSCEPKPWQARIAAHSAGLANPRKHLPHDCLRQVGP